MGDGRISETNHPVARIAQETESKQPSIPRTLRLPSTSGTESVNAQSGGLHSSLALDTSLVSLGTSDGELSAAQQRTTALINQYLTGQDQIERRQRMLLEQRCLQQFQQQQHLQALQLQQLNTSPSNNATDKLLLELVRNNPSLLSAIYRDEM